MKTTKTLTHKEHQSLREAANSLLQRHQAFQEKQNELVEAMRSLLTDRELIFSYIREKVSDQDDSKNIIIRKAISRAETFFDGVFAREGVTRHWVIVSYIAQLLDPDIDPRTEEELIKVIEKTIFECSYGLKGAPELINPRFSFNLGQELEKK